MPEVSYRLYEIVFTLYREIPRHFYSKEHLGKISLLPTNCTLAVLFHLL